jgi:hypothetical protein
VVTLLIPTIPAAMLIVISLQESFYNPQDCSTSWAQIPLSNRNFGQIRIMKNPNICMENKRITICIIVDPGNLKETELCSNVHSEEIEHCATWIAHWCNPLKHSKIYFGRSWKFEIYD